MPKPHLKSLFFLALLALAGVACSTSPTGRSQVTLKNDQELAVEAARQFAEMKANMPLETDRTKIDYIHCVAQAVVMELPPDYRDLEWEMAIFESDAVNAFAMPGGKIGVFSGILKVTENQHQLATVIGHEIAHVTAGHSVSRAGRDDLTRVGINAAAILLGGGYSGATYTAQQALSYGATFGISLPYKRGQETEADVVGLEYMAKAGFDPRAAVPLWQNMGQEAGQAPAEFLSTHPSSEKRIDQLVNQFGTTLKLYNEAKQAGKSPSCSM